MLQRALRKVASHMKAITFYRKMVKYPRNELNHYQYMAIVMMTLNIDTYLT